MTADWASTAETNIQQVARGEGETAASCKEEMGGSIGKGTQGQHKNNANYKG